MVNERRESCKRIESDNRFQHMHALYTWWSMNIHFQTSNFWITFELFHLPSLLFHLNVFFFSIAFQLHLIHFFLLFLFSFLFNSIHFQLHNCISNAPTPEFSIDKLLGSCVYEYRRRDISKNGSMEWNGLYFYNPKYTSNQNFKSV